MSEDKFNNLDAPILRLAGIGKTFPGVVALDGVDFDLRPGEVHGLCGENGAGKSTLMKILSGVYPEGTFTGEMFVDGKVQRYKSISDAQQLGIRIIHQELALVPELTVAQNIYLGAEPKGLIPGTLNNAKLEQQAQELLLRYDIELDPNQPVYRLSVGQQQLVEIAKALSSQTRILVLDEPTSALTQTETAKLLEILRNLKSRGVACVYISHKLDEVLEITDRVTILRDGKTIGTRATKDLTEEKIAALMVGRELSSRFPPKFDYRPELALELKNWNAWNDQGPGAICLRNIDLEVRAGEIVGIAGLMGSGRSELALSLFGNFGRHRSGQILVNGQNYQPQDARHAIESGVALVTEDRKRSGLVLMQSIHKNISMANLFRWSRFGVIEQHREIQLVDELFARLGVKAPSTENEVRTLSGGNQQKVVLAKWLATQPRVLILDEPTRGVDIGAKYEIYKLITELASTGLGVVMISSELPEILGTCHSVAVMHGGRLSQKLPIGDANEEVIMQLATGIKQRVPSPDSQSSPTGLTAPAKSTSVHQGVLQ